MSSTSRRAVLIGAAALTVTPATAIAAGTSGEPDPIFAAIERHRRAFPLKMQAMRAVGNEPDNGPRVNQERLAKLKSAENAACEEEKDAAWDLTTIRPTTAAGLVALTRYIEDFNAGTIGSDDKSSAFWWPADHMPDVQDAGIELFPYALLSNVRAALQRLA
jgi:hypothetical protein